MKKRLAVLVALAALLLPADLALGRGGRGGRIGRGVPGGTARAPTMPGATKRARNDKRSREAMRERTLAENRDAILRDGLADTA